MKLYISDDSELIEKDVVEKGWREDGEIPI